MLWQTTQAVTISGYQISLLSDTGGPSNRGTQLVKFYYGTEGNATNEVDSFNNGGASGNVVRRFADSITGDMFRIAVTRYNGAGVRIGEIDAIRTPVENSIVTLSAAGGT